MNQLSFSKHDALSLLLLIHHRAISVDDFCRHASTVEVTLALRHLTAAGGLSWGSRPLLLTRDHSATFMAVFSAPERAVRTQQNHPDFGTSLCMPLSWVIRAATDHMGLVINPGDRHSFEVDARFLHRLRSTLGATARSQKVLATTSPATARRLLA